MKKFKRITAWLLCVCTTAAMLPTGAALTDVNWTWGNITASKEITVAPEATYRALTVDSPVGIQRVNAIEFNPKNQHTKLRAGLSNGKVNGVQTVLGMANDMNKKHPGQVVAGINGDYFHLGQGVPFGIFMDEGEILSTPPQYSTAFGIKKDGTPFVVSHGSILDETLHIGDKKFALTGINNRHEDENSLIMYTDTFGSSTRAKKDSVEAVCVVMSGEPKHGETMKLKVKSLRASGGNAPIGENEVVLSGVGTRKNDIAYLKEGYEVSVTLKFNQFWSDVEFAIAGNRLLVSEGEVRQLSGSERAPRTVIGLKPDGKVVFYTIDGRMSGYSVGATFMQAGRIMKDLGCSYAMNLDGGGSTTFVMREPGDAMHKLINRPSDGEMRQVANGVILMNSAPVGEAKTLLIKQSGRKVLKGGTYQYSVAAIDANIQPKELDPAKTMWDVEPMHGTISAGGAFNATGAGMASIKVANETAKGVTTTEVIDAITAITPVKANIKIDANATKQVGVTLKRGNDSVEFTNNLLKWSVEGAIGKIDAEGKLTAGRAAATGNVVVSYGGIVKKIPVTVSGPEPEVFEKFKD
ncbi:MAG: phosphodiester glycosidase family protein, partial [Clostridia bacterium]